MPSSACQTLRSHPATAADSVSVVSGDLLDVSGQRNQFYGSVVYLIPNTRASRDWWDRLATRPKFWLADPYLELRLDYADRTTCDSAGRFAFKDVRPGDYFFHARVFWTNIVGQESLLDGGAYIAWTTVPAAETVHVMLKPPQLTFEGCIKGAPRDSGPVPGRPARSRDESLPANGQYVYVTEAAEILTQVAPVLPRDFDGRERTVVVRVLVGKDGRVKDARLYVLATVPGLNESALAAVKQYVFRPAYRGRRPVATWVNVPVSFRRS